MTPLTRYRHEQDGMREENGELLIPFKDTYFILAADVEAVVQANTEAMEMYIEANGKYHACKDALAAKEALVSELQERVYGLEGQVLNWNKVYGELKDERDTLHAELARMREALERIARHGVIMGSKDDYRQGQLDVLESVHAIAQAALQPSRGEQGVSGE